QRLGGRQRAALQRVGERFALEELHDQERLPVVVADVEELADVRVAQAGRGAGLADEALAGRGVAGVADGLDGHLAPQPLVLGGVDYAHATLAQLADDAVGADAVEHWFHLNRRVTSTVSEGPG